MTLLYGRGIQLRTVYGDAAMSRFKTSISLALSAFLVTTPVACAQGSATEALFADMPGGTAIRAVLPGGPAQSLYPNNVNCKDFYKVGQRIWILRNKGDIDLGNWDGAFAIHGSIVPRAFVNKGIDLYDVLEKHCEIYAR